MLWVLEGCPYCGGDVYGGTTRSQGYKHRPWLGKCLSCSRISKLTRTPTPMPRPAAQVPDTP